MKKPKAGKKVNKAKTAKRAPSRKPVAQKVEAHHEQVVGSHLDKPGAVEHPNHDQASHTPVDEVKGKVAVINRGADKVPVQLKDEAHLARLRSVHGADHVEVQS